MVNASYLPTDYNLTSYDALLYVANQVTGYWFGNLMVMAVFLVFFLGLGLYDKKESLVAASTIAFLFSVLMWAGNHVSAIAPGLTALMVVGSGFLLWKR